MSLSSCRFLLTFSAVVSLGSAVELWRDSMPVSLNGADAACLEPKLTGPCRAKVPRYFFNGVTQECEVFSYGGCGGNGNNFETLEECNGKCIRPVEEEKKSICQGPPQSGPSCEAIIPRWTFNESSQECVQFIYNGCGATKNNFLDQVDCQLQCGDTNSCLLPQAAGPCFANQKRWWFDASAGECSEFVYGGCGGNSNRYRTQSECEAVCRPLVKKQRLEIEQNSCEGIKCPGGTSHYTELGCKPIYDDGACCPTRFECPERELRNSSECVYKGKVYQTGDAVPAADSGLGCRASCSCNNGEVNCAHVECPELFGYFPKKGCRIGLYKPDQCCAQDYACGNETAVCELEGQKYVEGEKMYPKEEPCLVCYCKPGFNGTLSSEYCKKIDCGIEIWYTSYLQRGCTPVYFRNAEGQIGCCPISWTCPDEATATTSAVVEGNEATSTVSSETPATSTTLVPETKTTTGPVTGKMNFSCTEPKAVGDCKATRIRYFYNTSSSQCEEFEYSGCGGNGNNFQSLRQCVVACSNEANTESPIFSRLGPSTNVAVIVTADPCTEAPRTGRCRAYFRRWFFDPKENTCKLFVYGGCNRNGNNFYTKAACEATCIDVYRDACGYRPDDLTKDCGYEKSIKFYFDVGDGKCKMFNSTGCGSRNTFNRYSDCQALCAVGSNKGPQYAPPIIPAIASSASTTKENICLLPRQAGSCVGNYPSYYYDVTSKSCKSFIYGGCFGNRNRFLRLEDCQRTCEGANQAGGGAGSNGISFVDRPQVEDPNVMWWPHTASRRDSSTPAPDSVSERIQSPPVNQANSVSQEDSFIFSRMIPRPRPTPSPGIEVEETDSSTEDDQDMLQRSTQSSGEFSVTQFHLGPVRRSPEDIEEELEDDTEEPIMQESVQEGSFGKPQVEDPHVMVQRGSNSFHQPQVEDPNVMVQQRTDSFHLPQVEDPSLMRPTDFNLGQSSSGSPKAGSSVGGKTDRCTLEVSPGSCNQTVLRFHWDGTQCRPFNYTGCGGNLNRFTSEYECRKTCAHVDSFEELIGDLYCVYGNRIIPFGESLQGKEECGNQFCTCVVPPALTCTVRACESM